MKNIAAFTLCLFCVLMFSCKKEWTDPQNTPNQTITKTQYICVPDTIFHEDSANYSLYIYDEKHDVGNKEYRIDSINTYAGSILTRFEKYHYYDDISENNFGHLSKIEYFESGKLTSYISVLYKSGFQAESYTFYDVSNGSARITKKILPTYNRFGAVEKLVYYEPDANGLLEEKFEQRYVTFNLGKVSRIEEFTKTDSAYTLTAAINYEYNNYKNTFALQYLSPLDIKPHDFYGNITRETKTDANEKVIYSIINTFTVDVNASSSITAITGKTSTYSSDSGSSVSKDFYSFICRKR